MYECQPWLTTRDHHHLLRIFWPQDLDLAVYLQASRYLNYLMISFLPTFFRTAMKVRYNLLSKFLTRSIKISLVPLSNSCQIVGLRFNVHSKTVFFFLFCLYLFFFFSFFFDTHTKNGSTFRGLIGYGFERVFYDDIDINVLH